MIELFKDALAIYTTGSSVLPGIKNPADVDYIIVYQNEDILESHGQDLIEIQATTKYTAFWVIALDDITSGLGKILDNIEFADQNYRCGYAYFRTYISPMNTALLYGSTLLEGQDIHLQEYFNIINNNEYKNFMLRSLKLMRHKLMNTKIDNIGEDRSEEPASKSGYYGFLIYFIIMNDSYELDLDQQELLNELHDRKYSHRWCMIESAIINDY